MKKLLPIILLLSSSAFAAKDTEGNINAKTFPTHNLKVSDKKEILTATPFLDFESLVESPAINSAFITNPKVVFEGAKVNGQREFKVSLGVNSYEWVFEKVCKFYGYPKKKNLHNIDKRTAEFIFFNKEDEIQFLGRKTEKVYETIECYMEYTE